METIGVMIGLNSVEESIEMVGAGMEKKKGVWIRKKGKEKHVLRFASKQALPLASLQEPKRYLYE